MSSTAEKGNSFTDGCLCASEELEWRIGAPLADLRPTYPAARVVQVNDWETRVDLGNARVLVWSAFLYWNPIIMLSGS